MVRHGRRFGVVLMAAMMLATSFSHVVAPPARAFIANPITADASSDPNDFFEADDALFAYFTVDITGGDICVVNVNTVAAPGRDCQTGVAWGDANHFVGLGLQYEGLEEPYLAIGTWRLLAAPTPTVANPKPMPSLSEPFTVAPCSGPCDTSIGDAAIAAWKAAAGGATDGAVLACKAIAVQGAVDSVSGVASSIATMRGVLYEAGSFLKKGVKASTPISVAVVMDFSGGLISIPMPDYSSSEEMAMALLKQLLCSVALMHETIMQDPPDPNFTTVVQPVFQVIPNPSSDSGQALGISLDRQRAFGEAMLHAFERYLGAKDANEPEFVALQAQAMSDFGLSAAQEMRNSASMLDDYAGVLGADPALIDPIMPDQATLDAVLAIHARVRSSGFLPAELTELANEGYTTDEVAQLRAMFDLNYADVPIGVSIDTVLQDSAASFKAAAVAYDAIAREAGSVASMAAGAVNHAPVAVDDSLDGAQDTPIVANVLANDVDPDGDPVTLLSNTNGTHGSATCSTDGSCTYAPSAGYSGPDSFSYTIGDGLGLTASATVSVTVHQTATNDPPVASDDSLIGVQDTPATVNVLPNDTDPNFDVLTVTASTNGAHGTVVCQASGSCQYTPAAGFFGSDVFDYTVSDPDGASDTGTVSVTIGESVPGNAAPIAVDDTASTPINTAASIYVLFNDSDPDFDTLSVAANTSPTHGTVVCQSYGYCDYIPTAGYTGSDSFGYTLSDGRGGTDTATVTISVNPNQPPDAVDDTFTTRQNAVVRSVPVLVNDTDLEGDSLTVTSGTPATHGVAECQPTTCNYTPDAGYIGPDSFDYSISDGKGNSDTATVTVDVTENHPPLAYEDAAATIRNVSVTISPAGNDSDPDSDPLTFVSNGPAAHGDVDCSLSGGCTYSPDTGYEGVDGFDYTISDGDLEAVGHVTVTVYPPCRPAHCIDNGTILLAVNDQGHLNSSDGTGSKAGSGSVGLDYIPTNNDATAPGCLCEGWGAADAATGITGSANAAVGGVDGMTMESFNATASTAVSVVNIQGTLRVTQNYHPSTKTPNLYEVTVTIENITNGRLEDIRYRRVMDWDIEPTAFSEFVTIQGGNAANLLFDSNNGFETANPLGARSDLGYTGDFVDAGPDDHGALFDFGFGALDAGKSTTFNIYYGAAGTEDNAKEAINAVGAEVYSIGESNTEDGPTLGTPNTFIFAFGNVGGDPIFSPDAVDDILATDLNTAGTVDVLANDTDPDNDPLTVTTLAPSAAHGTVVCTAAGSCTYTPAVGYSGPDSFDYAISDGNGGTDTATVAVTVGGAANEPPVGVADSYSVARDTVLTVPVLTGVLANDTDADAGDTLTAAKVTDPSHGTVVLAADGSFSYTPTGAYVGPDSFTYNVSDGTATVGPVTVSITVTQPNRAPVGVADTYSGPQDTALVVPALTGVLANDTDADGNALTATKVGDPAHGSVALAADGSFTYTPTAGYFGPDSFTYMVSDGTISSGTTTVSITVTKTNHAPVGVSDTYNVDQDAVLTTSAGTGVLANDTDADGDTLTATKSSDPAHGSVTLNANGSFTYTPNAGYFGPDSFTYAAHDALASSATTTVSITVNRVNHTPTLGAINDQTIPEMVVWNSLTAAGSDIDGDALTYSLTVAPTGLVIGATSGTLTWTPTEAQGPGVYDVTVKVADPGTLFATRSFKITVTEVNRAPSLAALADQTVHPGDAVTATAVGSDPDLPANTLIYALVSGPAGAAVNATTGAFTWTASSTLGDYGVTISVSDGGLSASRSFTIHVVRDATALTLGGDSGSQYSDTATITATLKAGSTPLPAKSVTISLGAASQTVTTNASGVAAATFSIPGPAGSLATGASFAGTSAYAPSSATGTFAVSREDSTIVYSGDTIGLAGATLHLAATFTDSAAAGFTGSNPETGASATVGDITKARIAFAVYNAATCLTGSPITTLSAFVTDSGTAGDGIGTATVNWSSSSEGSFCIVPSLVGAAGTGTNGYYTAPPAEPAGLAVFIDTAGKVTGGGWVAIGADRGNFGFNASSTGTKVKGNLVFVQRATYQGKKAILIVKSNAIDALRTSGSTFPITATLTGKATYKFISAADGSTFAESGNATFTATVVDTDAAGGAGDSFAIRVLDKAGAVLVDLRATPLGGGNIVAHIRR